MNTEPTVIDRFVGYGIDRAAYAIMRWNKAFPSRSQRALPPYVGEDDYGNVNDLSLTGNESVLRHRALTLSWIYADVDLIAKEFSSTPFGIKKQSGEDISDVVNHPFETLLSNPNDEMTGAFLLQYTAWWMQLRGKAFWYLAPAKGNSDEIVEIWPLPADRVEAVKGKTTFIDRYTYKLRRGTKIDLNPDYVVYFRFPHPYDLWDGLAPLDAALNPLEIDQAEAKWQRDTYVNGRGIPASVLMLSEKMGDRDFAVAAQRIREDFEQGRKLAIARGNDLKVASIGITPQQLGLIESRQFTRDEIDTVFLGLAYHGFSSETGIVVADKILKEKKIWPMHVLMAGQMTTQLVRPFYGDEFLLEFDDIRPQDRSLDIQEFDTYSRVMTLNEARKERKLDDYKNEMFPELGKMPLKLATDPSFVLQYYPPKQTPSQELLGLSAPKEDRGIGSLPQSDTAENQTENAAERGTGEITGVNAAKGGPGSGNFAPGQGRGKGKPGSGKGSRVYISKMKFIKSRASERDKRDWMMSLDDYKQNEMDKLIRGTTIENANLLLRDDQGKVQVAAELSTMSMDLSTSEIGGLLKGRWLVIDWLATAPWNATKSSERIPGLGVAMMREIVRSMKANQVGIFLEAGSPASARFYVAIGMSRRNERELRYRFYWTRDDALAFAREYDQYISGK